MAVPFYTWGSSTCTIAAGEDVTVAGQVITITPYDRELSGTAVCTGDLRRFERQVTTQVPTGEVIFQLRGRRGGQADLTTLSRRVIVLPP